MPRRFSIDEDRLRRFAGHASAAYEASRKLRAQAEDVELDISRARTAALKDIEFPSRVPDEALPEPARTRVADLRVRLARIERDRAAATEAAGHVGAIADACRRYAAQAGIYVDAEGQAAATHLPGLKEV